MVSPLAGKLPEPGSLLDVPKLITAYYTDLPDPSVPSQRVAFGTSGHRGTSFERSFNEGHILAITQAICLYRRKMGVDGPLFLGIDTHALSIPAYATALEVLAANGVDVIIAEGDEYTPTPVISHAILTHNRGRTRGLADGIALTPSHNPPRAGGLKYNPPQGGPADLEATGWIGRIANMLLEAKLAGVNRIPLAAALRASTTHRRDFLTPYVADLASVVELEAVRDSTLSIGVDPLGGAGVHYWNRIAERYGLRLTVVSDVVDPTFRFMSADADGEIRMDPSSVYAMQRLIGMRDRFDISWACDTDHDRHGIVTRSAGLLRPNHYLCAAIFYLFQHRPEWREEAAIGKTIVSSQMIDRVAAQLGRKLYETPVGFKWFVGGLLNSGLGFAGEESAGASFLRRDGRPWTTDKDGIIPGLLAAEMMAHLGRDPGEFYRALTQELGEASYERVDVACSASQRAWLASITPQQIGLAELAGEKVQKVLTSAPGNGAPIGGVKVVAGTGWFAVRPSGTEPIYKIYAESFRGSGCLRRIMEQAQEMVSGLVPPSSPPLHQQTVSEAKEVWRNEGNPN
ncbi:MAG: phosphoglucomutase (alpha-D-glucose-1,6-bisphosphate-dependent) [Acidobacteria bacterium]|nr:phosphoglucomutase (alpha-D-glucose-1,6-bisphosphate-dependent) [Acidobacteriota bacterium]